MCKSKTATNVASPISNPRTTRTRTTRSHYEPKTAPIAPPSPFVFHHEPSSSSSRAAADSTGFILTCDTSIANPTSSLSTFQLENSLSENPQIYDFSEISSATNNFTPSRRSSIQSSRCTLRGTDVMVFHHKFRRRIETADLIQRLSVICRSHHASLVKLLGVSISASNNIYLVYEFVNGANLSDCLRNERNPKFTVLSDWISRMQIATDIAHGLDYIHNGMGFNERFTHNRINSREIVVTEPSFNAKICQFGAALLSGEIGEFAEESSPVLKPAGSRNSKIEGVRGYMSPEFQFSGVATQKSDVYAFGVVMLEILSGEEPLKYVVDETTGNFVRTSVIETARNAVESRSDAAVCGGGVRMWLDRRLRDSFPIEVAEKVTRVALQCVHVDPEKRPNMRYVAGMISKLYLESKIWSNSINVPSEISVSSLAPR